MSNDFVFYQSKDLNNRIEPPIQFDAVVAGETEEKQIVVQNNSEGLIEIGEVNAGGSDEVKVESFPESLDEGEAGKLVLSFQPNTTDHEPVDANLMFDYKITVSQ